MSKKKLMLVESPHKSKSIKAFLGPDYTVLPTVGSMFDIENPTTDAQKAKFDAHGVSTKTWERNLKASNAKQFALIRKEVQSGKYDTLIASTDPDRAGEQIAQDIVDALARDLSKNGMKVERATWREITKSAVEKGLANPGSIDSNAVAAANARQIYDRLFGFTISPVLWRTIYRGASGGRVQSPALRLIVNREKERLEFVKADYMSVTGHFAIGGDSVIAAKLISIGSRKIATGGSFGSDGKVKSKELVVDEPLWKRMKPFLEKQSYEVSDVDTKPYSRRPPWPYTTSSFQQDVGTRLRLSSKQIMSVAQRLYESGYVTYMRTDSPALSKEGTFAARGEAMRLFGSSAVPAKPNFFKSKAKNSQEGHEALRPTCDSSGKFLTPKSLKSHLDKIDKNAYKVYECIYNRTVASQMNDAKGFTTTVKISTTGTTEKETSVFSTSATVFTEPGWTALTKPVSKDEEENNSLDAKVSVGQDADLKKLTSASHSTTPPARFTEPQLVAKLEELGIGRPSTYSSIVTVNQTRGYVMKKGQQMYPTWTGMKVAQYLEGNVEDFVTYDATADMEEELDKIEEGTLSMSAFLSKAWAKIQADVESLKDNIDWSKVDAVSRIDLHNGYQVRVNSYGAWLEDTSVPLDSEGKRAGVKLSDDETVGELDFTDPEVCKKLYEAGSNKVEARELGVLETGEYAGWTVTARDGKYGPFVQAVKPDAKKTDKPVNHPLPEGTELSTVTLEDVSPAFQEIKLPRTLSSNFFTGIGKKGPWLGFKKTPKARRAEFKSLPDGLDPRTLTLEEAKRVWEGKEE